ncbi:MAG: glycosyltransferase family 39 protein [Anaerolineae bacterium]|jgi:4-amino-4-deoxy-L-arabinose transferase-like glycosyltransferase
MRLSIDETLAARLLTVGLLLLSFGLALTSAVQKSPTMDEQNHIARGAAYLGTGDPRLSVEHPPLVNVLSALPAHFLLDLQLPLDTIWWEAGEWYHFADNFLWDFNQDPDRMVFLARLPILGIGLLLTALVFRWAGSRFGSWGGLLAAAFSALDPNILAHERLSTTDVGGAFFALLAAYVFWRWFRQRSLAGTLLAGLTLGLAFTAKLSALVFGPVLALVSLLDDALGGLGQPRLLVRRVGMLVGVAALSVMVIWASYGFKTGSLENVPYTIPASPYVQGVQAVLDLAGGGRSAYLLGEISTQGWWYYFPVAFAVKTPLATLGGLLFATWVLISRPSRDDLFILVPPLVFLLVSATTRLNLGYRHLLVMQPFLAIHIGRLVRLPIHKSDGCSKYMPFFLAGWLAISTLATYPHFLAYFNRIGGGADHGWHVLVDSNIDWGQDMKGLRKWMAREGVERVRLSWFGSARPEAYGVQHDLLPGVPYGFSAWQDPLFDPQQPEPGVYAISVSNLVGVALPDHDLYAWFRARAPDAKIGYSLFVYRVADL